MTKHPTNRYERLLVNEKKKDQREERAAKVWRKRKLSKDKEQENEDELAQHISGNLGSDSTGLDNQPLVRNTVDPSQ